jgi:O-antigen/teichoic acid export membrane protein
MRPSFIAKLRPKNRLAANTAWMTAGQGLRLIVQALYFGLIARSLGAAHYGAFVAVAALVGIAYPFGSLGFGYLLIQEVARDNKTFRPAWGAALLMNLCFGTALVGLICMSAHLFLPPSIPSSLVALVAGADIVFLNLLLLSAQAFQAVEKLHWTAAIYLSISLSRLIAAAFVISLVRHPSPTQWGVGYFAGSTVVAAFAVGFVCRQLGWPQFRSSISRRHIISGFYFASSASAQTIYNDLDKTMLARLSTLEATGIYGAAYRILEVSFSPIQSLMNAAYPRFFQAGAAGLRASVDYARPLLIKCLGFSVLLVAGLFIAAEWIPSFLGHQYYEATIALRWLAVIVVLRTLHAFCLDILTTSGRQGLRALIQIAVCLVNLVLNLRWIPAYSWRGATASSILCDLLLAVIGGGAVLILARKSSAVLDGITCRHSEA